MLPAVHETFMDMPCSAGDLQAVPLCIPKCHTFDLRRTLLGAAGSAAELAKCLSLAFSGVSSAGI